MSDELPATAWDPEPGSAAGAEGIYGGVFALAVLLLPDPIRGWWNFAVLVPGSLVIGVVAWRLYPATKYTLTASAIVRSCRGRNEAIPLGDLTEIYGYYPNRAGDFIVLRSGDRGFELRLGRKAHRPERPPCPRHERAFAATRLPPSCTGTFGASTSRPRSASSAPLA